MGSQDEMMKKLLEENKALSAEVERLGKLCAENEMLAGQVKMLVKVECEIYEKKELMDRQIKIYTAVSDIGRKLNDAVSLERVIKDIPSYFAYGLNLERAILLWRSRNEPSLFEAVSFEGYEEDQNDHVSMITLSSDDPAFTLINSERGRVCFNRSESDENLKALSRKILIDEFFIFIFEDNDGNISGILFVGNTKEQAKYYSVVINDNVLKIAFSTLNALSSSAIRKSILYRDLEKQRDELEIKVKERTEKLEKAMHELQNATQAIRNIMNNVKTGLMLIDKDLRVLPGFSEYCNTLFMRKIEPSDSIIALLRPYEQSKKFFEIALKQVFDNDLPDEIALKQIPTTFEIGGKILRVDSSAVKNESDQVTSVLFTIVDETRLMVAERELRYNKSLVNILRNKR
ncbi:MAG: hypothetical protein HQK54_12755 [Oligoflexales bacterium]|nr:hypothetical protein [Oligoflexales bacterium]